jgi:hypothetical protein
MNGATSPTEKTNPVTTKRGVFETVRLYVDTPCGCDEGCGCCNNGEAIMQLKLYYKKT